jgi:hypothetical protein
MITQQTPPGRNACSNRWSREPERLCREAFSSQDMAILHHSDTNLTSSTAGISRPEREDDERLR